MGRFDRNIEASEWQAIANIVGASGVLGVVPGTVILWLFAKASLPVGGGD